jgi:hypothetical protein
MESSLTLLSSLFPGIYGTKGVSTTSTIPGARYGARFWRGFTGELWMFGGFGYDDGSFGFGKPSSLFGDVHFFCLNVEIGIEITN